MSELPRRPAPRRPAPCRVAKPAPPQGPLLPAPLGDVYKVEKLRGKPRAAPAHVAPGQSSAAVVDLTVDWKSPLRLVCDAMDLAALSPICAGKPAGVAHPAEPRPTREVPACLS